MSRAVTKDGLSARCLVRFSHVIGVARPLLLFVEAYGTELVAFAVNDIANILKNEFGYPMACKALRKWCEKCEHLRVEVASQKCKQVGADGEYRVLLHNRTEVFKDEHGSADPFAPALREELAA